MAKALDAHWWKKLIKYIWEMFPAWSSLRSLGNNRIIKTSYLWLFIVPIVAKLIQEFPSQFKITDDLILTLGLPFSWHMFYFAAVCFTFASILYSWKCPPLIRDYADWSEYKKKAGSIDLAQNTLVDHCMTYDYFHDRHRDKGDLLSMVEYIITQYCSPGQHTNINDDSPPSYDVSVKDQTVDKAHNLRPLTPKEPGFFWAVRENIEYIHPTIREIITILFSVGFILIGYLFFINIWYVAKLFLAG